MSIEHEPRPELNKIDNFLMEIFLKAYINDASCSLCPEDKAFAKTAIPQLIDTFFSACRNSNLNKITAGGTVMEAYSEQETSGSGELYAESYWAIKEKFLKLDSEVIATLSNEVRNNSSKEALKCLGGEPDLDTYVSTNEQLETLHHNLESTLLSDDIKVTYGPISETNKVQRLSLEIISPFSHKPIFHIDSTASPITGNDVALNRRIGTTDYQSLVCHKINTRSKEIIPEPIVDLDKPVSLAISERSPGSAIEIILRQIRKSLIRKVAHNQESSVIDLTHIFDQDTTFEIIQLVSNPDNKKLFDEQSPVQQKMWLKEFYVIMMTDLQSLDTLFQLKLLPLITGKNYTRKQILTLMSGSSYTFNDVDPQQPKRMRNNSVVEIDDSIANFRQLPIKNKNRDGLTAFALALENFQRKHTDNNPAIRSKRLQTIYDTLTEWGGGLTTTMLHRIIREDNVPEENNQWDSNEDFSRLVINLIANGHIEIVTRDMAEKPVRFLYPSDQHTKTNVPNSPFSTAEAIFGLRVKDGRLFPNSVQMLFENLDELKRKEILFEKRNKRYNHWFDPEVDS